MTLEAASQLVDIVGTSGATARYSGWVAPAHLEPTGEQPAVLYLSAPEDAVAVGDRVVVGTRTYVAVSVSYWPPGDLEVVLSGVVLADRCRIERRTGQTLDDATNTVTQTWATLWTGPCDIQPASLATRGEVAGAAGVSTALSRLVASLPATVVDVIPGDVVVVESSADARLVGARLVVTGVRMSTTPGLRVLLLEAAE